MKQWQCCPRAHRALHRPEQGSQHSARHINTARRASAPGTGFGSRVLEASRTKASSLAAILFANQSISSDAEETQCSCQATERRAKSLRPAGHPLPIFQCCPAQHHHSFPEAAPNLPPASQEPHSTERQPCCVPTQPALQPACLLPQQPTLLQPNVHFLILQVPHSARNSVPQQFTCQTAPPRSTIHTFCTKAFSWHNAYLLITQHFWWLIVQVVLQGLFMELPMKLHTDAADLGTFYLLVDSATNRNLQASNLPQAHKSLNTISAKRLLNVNA